MKYKKITIFILTILAISCFNKEDKKKENGNNKNIKSRIFELANKNIEKNEKDDILNLNENEKEFLLKNKIDPAKVSEELRKAKSGNLNSILNLAQLYYGLTNKEKAKEILEIGVGKKYPEAIYNLMIIYKEEGNIAKVVELSKKLETLKLGNELKEKIGENGVDALFYEEYNKGIDLLKEKKYEESIKWFEKAYSKGVKDADVRIAYLYDEMKNVDKAVEWLKKAVARGDKNANHNLGVILFSSGKTVEARPYLMKSYRAGNKKLAMAIAISYNDEKNMKDALKWYEIAAKNGDEEAEKIVKDIKNTEQKKLIKTFEFFIDNTSEYSLTDRMILEYLYPPKPEEPVKEVTKSNKKTGEYLASKAEKKTNYNITEEEIFYTDRIEMDYKEKIKILK